ncbi:hypothetical protein [Collinsella aerofaciens]|uniref:hypothetical protein n=1 Tax=Collinsella aerofaciens TaxID=74426 RepID=UPI00359C1E39
MAKINLVCEHCGGAIKLDNSHEVGMCENCFSQFIVKEDKIVQNITQHITKHVYGYAGKDVEELLIDADDLLDCGDEAAANRKYKRAIDIQPDCWEAWLGYANTRGDRSHYISMVPAYIHTCNVAANEQQIVRTFVDMTSWIPISNIRSAFVRAFNLAPSSERRQIFKLVSDVIGCDETEIAALAVDLCPDDWRTNFEMAKVRQIRARWSQPEGFFKSKWPEQTEEVFRLFGKAYDLAKKDGEQAASSVATYINGLARDGSYATFANELKRRIGI